MYYITYIKCRSKFAGSFAHIIFLALKICWFVQIEYINLWAQQLNWKINQKLMADVVTFHSNVCGAEQTTQRKVKNEDQLSSSWIFLTAIISNKIKDSLLQVLDRAIHEWMLTDAPSRMQKILTSGKTMFWCTLKLNTLLTCPMNHCTKDVFISDWMCVFMKKWYTCMHNEQT